MAIRDLKTFLAIAEGGSFAAAARTVRRTQSAVTVQMKALEEELGVSLFDRSKRPPTLSEAGRALVPRAAEVVRAYDRLFQDAGASAVEGHLRLGVVPSVVTGLMPRALAALREKYPAMHVELTVGLSRDLVERVHRDGLDAAVISDLLEGGTGLHWAPFAREPLVLIAPPDALGRRAEDLIGAYPFIRYTRQAWVGQIIDGYLKKKRLKVAEAMTLDTLEAVAAMVHHGLGVSVVPQRAGGDPLGSPVRVVPFSGAPAHRTLGLVRTASHAKAALAEALLRELTALAGSAAPQTVKRKRT
ncbi:MAG TPA: LysR family transcriptional regulator [Beijerinckiaceae bacterium]|jgi:DNA-binding transcriptional LysR family regulator